MVLNIKLIILFLALSSASLIVWRYIHTIEKNKLLTALVSGQNITIENLDDKVSLENTITVDSDAILKEIRNAPKEDDAPVAPVLDNAIDAIDRLR